MVELLEGVLGNFIDVCSPVEVGQEDISQHMAYHDTVLS